MKGPRVSFRMLFTVLALQSVVCSAQSSSSLAGINRKIDSIRTLVNRDREDSLKVDHLNTLSHYTQTIARYDTAEVLANSALKLALKLKFARGATASYINLGNLYSHKGIYEKGLEYLFQALRLSEARNDKRGIASCYNNIGILFRDMGDYSQALNYQLDALRLRLEAGDKTTIGASYNNIGNIYFQLGDYKKAIDYHSLSLKAKAEQKDIRGTAFSFNNIGSCYFNLKQVDSAIVNYKKALAIREAIGDRKGIAGTSINLASSYIEINDVMLARAYSEKALRVAEKLGSYDELNDVYGVISEVESRAGNFKKSLEYYKLFVSYKDSISNEENTKRSVQIQMKYEFDKISAEDSIRNAEAKKVNDLKHAQEIAKQRMYTTAGVIAFLVMIVITAISIVAYRNKQRSNKEIARQKMLVEEKQKEILDSIYYARRIQRALITSELYVARNLMRLKNSGSGK